MQTIEMFEVITQSQPMDYQSLEILKEAYLKLGRESDVINTSKRIAQAYVQLGQLSSAILEYETILQGHPEDPDVLAAMSEIESKAQSLTSVPAMVEDVVYRQPAPGESRKAGGKAAGVIEADDGREMMAKLLVEGRVVNQGDFDACWPSPNLTEPPGQVVEPLIQVLSDKAIIPLEQSLKVLVEKTRFGYIPIEKYDVDSEIVRAFSKDICRRWCILPFDRMSKTVLVATANPFNKRAADELKGTTNQRFLFYVASPVEIIKVLRKVFR